MPIFSTTPESMAETWLGAAAWAPGTPLPPTFLKALEGEHYSSAALMKLLNVPLRGVTERDLYIMMPLFAFLVFRPGGIFAKASGRD